MTPKFCPSCGEPAKEGAKSCTGCGAGLGEKELFRQGQEQREKVLTQQPPKKMVGVKTTTSEEESSCFIAYLGGLGGLAGVTTKTNQVLEIRFGDTQLTVESLSILGKNEVLWATPYDRIKDIHIETGENLPAARFAFGLKKKHRYLVISFEDEYGLEQNPVFEGPGIETAQRSIYQRMVEVDRQPQKSQAPIGTLQPQANYTYQPSVHYNSQSRPQQGPAPAYLPDRKNPGVAAVLSFFWTGLGQIYNGQIGKGISLIILQAFNFLLIFVLIGFITFPLVWAMGIWDAYRTAESYNRAMSYSVAGYRQ